MSCSLRRSVLPFLACLLIATGAAAQTTPATPTPVAAPQGIKATYQATSGTISYHLVHTFHNVTGTSKQVAGAARFLNDGRVQVQITSPVASFDSGNGNRDTHMKEATEAAKFPTVVVKAATKQLPIPTAFPATFEKNHFPTVEVDFHNRKETTPLNEVKITFSDADTIQVKGAFSISLEKFKVERPSLLFIKVNDDVKISFDITFKKS